MIIDQEKFNTEKQKVIDEKFREFMVKFPVALQNDELKEVLRVVYSSGFGAGMLDGVTELKTHLDKILAQKDGK